MIRNWRSDEALKSAAGEGFQIKGRELFVRDEKIVLRTTGILGALHSTGDMQIDDSSITWTFDDEIIVETNGRISDTDSKKIIWPKDAPELHVKFREALGESYKESQPQMLELLQAYLANLEK